MDPSTQRGTREKRKRNERSEFRREGERDRETKQLTSLKSRESAVRKANIARKYGSSSCCRMSRLVLARHRPVSSGL